jgi:hypothetical protein
MMAANVNNLYCCKTLKLKKWKNFNKAAPVSVLFNIHRPGSPPHKKNSKYNSSKTGLISLSVFHSCRPAPPYLEIRKEVCHFAA